MLNKPLLGCLAGGAGALAISITQNPERQPVPPPNPVPPVEQAADAEVAVPSTVKESDPLAPPLGMEWGESRERLLAWASEGGLQHRVVTASRPKGICTVQVAPRDGAALPGHDASSLEASFVDDRLFEVALHYRFAERKVAYIEHRFHQLKELLSLRHGAFDPAGDSLETRDEVVCENRRFRAEPAHNRQLILSFTELLHTGSGEAEAHFQVVYHNDSILDGRPAPKRKSRHESGVIAGLK